MVEGFADRPSSAQRWTYGIDASARLDSDCETACGCN
jgi:hypothetical protein